MALAAWAASAERAHGASRRPDAEQHAERGGEHGGAEQGHADAVERALQLLRATRSRSSWRPTDGSGMPTARTGLPRTVAIMRAGTASSRTFVAQRLGDGRFAELGRERRPLARGRTGWAATTPGFCRRASTPCTDVGSDSSSFWVMRAFL